MPEGLSYIANSLFKGCSSLSEIILPSSIEEICNNAFENCISLESVNIKRETYNIVSLGTNVFDNSLSKIQIIVYYKRICEYKNAENWNKLKEYIISENYDYEEIELDCLMPINYYESKLEVGTNELVKIQVNCTKSYKFLFDKDIRINIYDYSMTKVYSGLKSLTCYLNSTFYYLEFMLEDYTMSNNVILSYSIAYPNTSIQFNNINNITNVVHNHSNLIKHGFFEFYNSYGTGLYKISLNVDNVSYYPECAIKLYSNVERTNIVNRFNINAINLNAISNVNENEMYVYLTNKTDYYLDINLNNEAYTNITIIIESVECNDLDYTSNLSNIAFDVLFENDDSLTYFEKADISHFSELQLDITTYGSIENNIDVYVFKEVYNENQNISYLDIIYIGEITSINRAPVFTFVIEEGLYYFGFINNNSNADITFSIKRNVQFNELIGQVLICDPAETGYELGTEVTINGGNCNENYITEGFTRNIYLMFENSYTDPISRLDYYWFSSNDNVAKVTEWGTILGMSVEEDTNVMIYAVLKTDPTVVYCKLITIKNDLDNSIIEVESIISYSYGKENGKYKIELDFNNSPFPFIQYYSWSIINDSNEIVLIDYWGFVESSGPVEVVLIGDYFLNPKIKLYITLIINE